MHVGVFTIPALSPSLSFSFHSQPCFSIPKESHHIFLLDAKLRRSLFLLLLCSSQSLCHLRIVNNIEAPISNVKQYERNRKYNSRVFIDHIHIFYFWQRGLDHTCALFQLVQQASSLPVFPVRCMSSSNWKTVISVHPETGRETLV